MTATKLSLADRDGLKSPFGMLHHVALVTNDMAKTVAFYRDVLGSEIAMAHRMSRPEAERHYFITVAPNTVFAFFEFPDAELPEFQDATLPKTGRALDHICFFIESAEELERWKEHLEKYNVPIHGYAPGGTFFFPDPNDIIIQLTVNGGGPMGFPVHDDPNPAYDPPK
jgi:catechol 2,3-dioxygenase-like lactoylglutathione lyase family enzyme